MRRHAHGDCDSGSGRDAGTLGIAVYLDVYWAFLGSIPCNGAVKRIPKGVVCTNGLAIEVVWAVLSRRYTVFMYVRVDYFYVWVHRQTLLLQSH